MATLVLGQTPPELEELLERRRLAGADRFDEVWEGVYHVVPAPGHGHARLEIQVYVALEPLAREASLELTSQFNLGKSEHDFRVPDGGLHRPGAAELWHPTAALVIEIVSPGDKSLEKLPFYAGHGVDEVLLVDPGERTVTWLALRDGEYHAIQRSGLVALGAAALAERLEWPQL